MAGETGQYLKGIQSPTALTRILEFEVPRERVEAAIEEIIQGIRKEIALPGFRKGKAPADVLRARFGETARKEAIERLIPEAYQDTLSKESLRPVLPAEISNLTYEDTGPLSFHIAIELRPTVELKPYRAIKVKKETKPVEDGDVEREIEGLRERFARFDKVEGEAQPGHFVIIDYWRIGADDKPVKGSRISGYPVELGSGKLVGEFDQGLRGTRIGDIKTIDVTYPTDSSDAGLRGKQVRFGVEVKEITRKVSPEVDDAFAKTFKVDSVEALKARVREGLGRAYEEDATSKVRQELLKTIVEDNTFEVPGGLVTMALDSLLKSYREEFEAGAEAGWEEKLKEIGEKLKPLAINLVKEQFIVDEIAKREGIVAKDEEIEEILGSIAARSGISIEEARTRAEKSDETIRWRRDIIRNKVLDFLYQNADVET